jgi:hypothetical protein
VIRRPPLVLSHARASCAPSPEPGMQLPELDVDRLPLHLRLIVSS